MADLPPGAFVSEVPQQSPGLPDPNPVVGDRVGQHPGAFGTGVPEAGTFFVGLIPSFQPFSDAPVYLWETSAFPIEGTFAGPKVEIGWWDGASFTRYGNAQIATFAGTGAMGENGLEIAASVMPLALFGVAPGYTPMLNAVRVEAVAGSHNQVSAVAEGWPVVCAGCGAAPEPGAAALVALGAAAVALGRARYTPRR